MSEILPDRRNDIHWRATSVISAPSGSGEPAPVRAAMRPVPSGYRHLTPAFWLPPSAQLPPSAGQQLWRTVFPRVGQASRPAPEPAEAPTTKLERLAFQEEGRPQWVRQASNAVPLSLAEDQERSRSTWAGR